MEHVTVKMDIPSLYDEPNSRFYRTKRRLTFSNIIKKIKTVVKRDQAFSLLEIGTGSGHFMSFLEEEFVNAKLTGLEYDSRLVFSSMKKLKRAKILQGNAENFNLNNTFDVIVSLQVIEHLYNPELMLAAIKKHLKPQGVLILTTPNLGCLSEKIMKDKWHGYREDHVSLKNCLEWKSLVEKSGFSSIYIGSTFFSGIPLLNRFPFGIFNWILLLLIGSLKWKYGESFIGLFRNVDINEKYGKH